MSTTSLFSIGAVMSWGIATVFLIAPLRGQWSPQRIGGVVGLSTALVLSSVWLYQHYGALHAVQDKAIITDIAQRLSSLQQAGTLSAEKVLNTLEEVESRLPKRPLSWAYLAGVYQHLGFLAKASMAYHHAFELNPKMLSYLTQEAYVLSKMNNGRLPEPLKNHLATLLQQDLKNQDALTLLAMDAYRRKDYPLAIDYWQRLLAQADTLSAEDMIHIKALVLKAKHSV